MDKSQYKVQMRAGRHKRIRAKVSGTAVRPRLAIYKSNTAVYAQLINDEAGVTIAAVDSRKTKGTVGAGAVSVGTEIATKAKAAGITEVVFDRGGFRYMGVVAALADSARAAGLKF